VRMQSNLSPKAKLDCAGSWVEAQDPIGDYR